MAENPFVHLHNHTDYSLLDGACEIDQLMDVVAEQKMPAVAMTDHGNLFGAVKFYNAAKAKGIHPVIGCEVYVSQQGHKTRSDTDRYNHLVLLCEDQDGYRNLIKMVSTAYLEGFYYKPRIDKEMLAAHSKGLVCLSACLRGDLNEAVLNDKYDDARRLAYTYRDIFGKDNFFLEIQDHGLEQDKRLTPQINRLSVETGIPLVATNDSHYLRREDARAHEILMCIQTGKTMSDPNRMHWDHPDFYLKTRDEMMGLFGELEDAVNRPWDIAQRCNVKLEKAKDPFPRFDIPPSHTTDSYFAYVAREGFEKRRPRLEALRASGHLKFDLGHYLERLEFEIQMIQQMKFSGYFLIVWDFIRFSKMKNIPVGPGRGSAAGSLVSYAMQITDIDPLQYGLLFERFLNPERISMPDIDIDFCMNRRGEVIQYVTEKYGREQVAQIITFNTLGARAAIKDVGRVLDMSFGDVDKITKLVPTTLNIKLKDAIEQEPGFAALAKADPRVQEVLDVARRLEGFARNSSVHAAGVVISPEPLRNIVPLYRTNREEVVTQYDMNGLEKLALLKMDFLGLTTLTLIDDALKMIERRHGVLIVPEELNTEDPGAYEIFCKGFTSGIFQFESPGMRDILRRYQPSRIEDLTALNALYRPGPMAMIDDFIDRKHGRKPVVYDLPEMKEVLEETYGVMIYQEQVMQISNRVAGYSLGDADILRRAMGKKKVEEMDKQRSRFLAGAAERGHPSKKAEKIFDLMAQFAGYGFNKSHSAAYSYVAFITAYLKAHYPVDFMAALLTSETGNTAKVVKYINECREMNIRVLPPDVNASEYTFTPVKDELGDAIRFGLGAVKNVGQGAVEAIIKARTEIGRFKSIYQFCEHSDMQAINRRVMESLVKAGAMDSMEGTRAQLLLALDAAIETGNRAAKDRDSGQGGLFGGPAELQPEPALPRANDWTLKEKLNGEKELLGFYVTGHPLDSYEEKIAELATHDSSKLEDLEKGAEVALCGMLTGIQKRRNKEGKAWASLVIEDRLGNIEAMVFTTQYERLAAMLLEDQAVLVRGSALPEEGNPTKISIQEIVPLDLARVPLPSLIGIKVFVGRTDASKLHELFARKPGDTQVRLRIESARDFSVVLDVPAKVRPDREFRAELTRLCGPDPMQVLGG
ncbi:MAG TPA: DNA polymerase III subunit alpha [Bryobacteraceae bacterium]|jgi:DNA polymerase-3 subunit alpha|nr:DNA polymerase III subunit alpha [Bryobacteraceae bacterium]